MARSKSLKLSCFNITVMSGSPDLYRALLETTYKNRRSVKVFGDTHLIISSLDSSKERLEGVISRFTKIDMEGDWFNAQNLATAEEEDKRLIFVPPYLSPNHKYFHFIFDEKRHKFYFETYANGASLSVKQCQEFLSRALNQTAGELGLREVFVNAVSWFENIERVLSSMKISNLEMVVEPPNPDDLEQIEEETKRRLQSQNAKSLTEILVAAGPEGVKPDRETLNFARVAARNGKVEISGTEGNSRVFYSTESHPAVVTERFDPDVFSELEAFRRGVSRFEREDRNDLRRSASSESEARNNAAPESAS
jgi:hypothetical protein